MIEENSLRVAVHLEQAQVKCCRLLQRHSGSLLLLFGTVLLLNGMQDVALAQTGEGIFDDAACVLGQEVLTKEYGAMLSAIAGLLAIITSVMGAFKSAWALVFVTVGTFTFPQIVSELFNIQEGCGGG